MDEKERLRLLGSFNVYDYVSVVSEVGYQKKENVSYEGTIVQVNPYNVILDPGGNSSREIVHFSQIVSCRVVSSPVSEALNDLEMSVKNHKKRRGN